MDFDMNLEKNQAVFKHFEKLCSIPHGSGNTKMISDYIKSFATERGFEVIQDELNNLIVFVPATPSYENEETLILQGHIDMVCEKTPDCDIDFAKDGLRIENDGIYMYANGTTLGGDDGIAVAYMMAIMDSKEIPHPALEMVMTVDEEVGMDGAVAIDLSMLKGKKLINIDSEEEGSFLTSCAGGRTLSGVIPISREKKKLARANIIIDGLKGGHSGCEIDKGRANSNVLAGRVLLTLEKTSVEIIAVKGGLKDNAIPRSTVLEIAFDKNEKSQIEEYLVSLNNELKNEYQSSDADISISLSDITDADTEVNVFDKSSKEKLVMTLNNIPNGIIGMSMGMPGLVETSLNLGILTTNEESFTVSFAVRSSVESQKVYLSDRTARFIEYIGGRASVNGDYPGWQYRSESALRDRFVACYERMYECSPKLEAIHAGLECGLLAGKIDDLDCISFGPEILDIHTVEERLNLASAIRTYNLLLMVLETKNN